MNGKINFSSKLILSLTIIALFCWTDASDNFNEIWQRRNDDAARSRPKQQQQLQQQHTVKFHQQHEYSSIIDPEPTNIDIKGSSGSIITGKSIHVEQQRPIRHWLQRQGKLRRSKRWREAEKSVENEKQSIKQSEGSIKEKEEEHEFHGIHVASWRWDEIGIYVTFTLFIIVAGLAKVAFHHAHAISSRIPESCLLILLGTAVGGILYAAGVGLCEGVRGATRVPGCSPPENGDKDQFVFPVFTPQLFFFILLPPIILESSYSLYDRTFANNLGTVLFYAVIGTIFNTFVIGFALVGLTAVGAIGPVSVPEDSHIEWWSGPLYNLQPTDCLVFSALISAVDPVAVLAIFQEVGINKDLYFLVFGESLLNDAVTVVLYTTMVAFATMPHASGEQYALGLASFFTVSLGGLSIGIVCGLITALITRTTSDVRVVEPLAVLGMAYLSYMSAELFHFSGIISMIGCGLVQAHYAFSNISHKSFTTVKYFIKMLSSTSDAIIFLFLGMVLVNDVHEWHTGFVLWSLALCFVARFAGVYLLTAIANRFRLDPINFKEQFIMAYGGLRGAVSFSLVEMLEPSAVKPRQMFVTTTLVVILFTVFIQGGTIKLFVNLLNIEKDGKKQKHLTDEINETLIYHITAGIEEICGRHGKNFFREKIEYIDEHYLRKIFTRKTENNSLTRLFEKLALSEHYANMYTSTNGQAPVSNEKFTEVEVLEPPKTILEDEGLSITPSPSITSSEIVPESRKRNPLIRQSSAPPYMERRSLLSETEKEDRFLEDLSTVELRQKPGRSSRPNSMENSGPVDPTAAEHALRHALKKSSANNYIRSYKKTNRNLIGDDDFPEVPYVFRRRLSSAPASRNSQTTVSSGPLSTSPMSSPGTSSTSRRNSETLPTPVKTLSFDGHLPRSSNNGQSYFPVRPEVQLRQGPGRRSSDSRTSTSPTAGESAAKSRTRTPFSTLGIIEEAEANSVLQIEDLESEEDVVDQQLLRNKGTATKVSFKETTM